MNHQTENPGLWDCFRQHEKGVDLWIEKNLPLLGRINRLCVKYKWVIVLGVLVDVCLVYAYYHYK